LLVLVVLSYLYWASFGFLLEIRGWALRPRGR
jgi:hypothetical protein